MLTEVKYLLYDDLQVLNQYWLGMLYLLEGRTVKCYKIWKSISIGHVEILPSQLSFNKYEYFMNIISKLKDIDK
jgi:hypothetical protein